jgi:hypothetical protein
MDYGVGRGRYLENLISCLVLKPDSKEKKKTKLKPKRYYF